MRICAGGFSPTWATLTCPIFPAMPYGLDLSLVGEDSENGGAWRHLTVLVHQGDSPVGLAEDMGVRHVISTRSTKHLRG